ncbi:MAG: hypothetical protein CSB24_04805 [Deltaproteobacteria bacterium]|nr:MAG: hypothetical protein CSB24_04805 [Deltaproteobacteria bacterium]
MKIFNLLLSVFLFSALTAGPCLALDLHTKFRKQREKQRETYTKDTGNIPDGVMIPELIPLLYQGGEKLKYDISWTGGVKIGEALIEIKKIAGKEDTYNLKVRITSKNGAFSLVYPVDDRHITTVQGPERLPIRHESWQKEGFGYRSHKITEYNQKTGKYTYWSNDKPPRYFTVSGKTQNEFSGFMASRLMPFQPGKPFVVPTWADKMRVKVVVETGQTERLKKTILGEVDTIKIMPILTFSGTYDQRGDTTIWYTNDKCRVPVQVNSKIVIGSLNATLVGWENPACGIYPPVKRY